MFYVSADGKAAPALGPERCSRCGRPNAGPGTACPRCVAREVKAILAEMAQPGAAATPAGFMCFWRMKTKERT